MNRDYLCKICRLNEYCQHNYDFECQEVYDFVVNIGLIPRRTRIYDTDKGYRLTNKIKNLLQESLPAETKPKDMQ